MAEIQKMRNKIAPYNRLYLDGPGQKAAAWADHRRIYEACCAGDPDVVVQETERHLDRVSQAIMAEV